MNFKIPSYIFFGLSIIFLFQGCVNLGSGSGSSGDSRTYSESFEEVNEMVKEGISKTKLGITDVEESADNSTTTYFITNQKSVAKRHSQQEQGEVRVQKMEDGKIQVTVENPEYHYTVPSYEKEDYKRLVFQVLDRMNSEEKKAGK